MIGIYAIENLENRRVYIGQSKNIEGRFNTHKSKLRTNKHSNKKLQIDWDKQEEKTFILTILEKCKLDDLDKKERVWIKFFKDKAYEIYNTLDGGKNGKGRVVTKEQRKKQSEMMKGRFAGEKHPNYGKVGYWSGKKKPQEITDIVAEKNRGQTRTDEAREKMRQAKLGKEPSNKFIPSQECLDEIKNGMTQPQFTKKYGYSKNTFKRLRKELKESGEVQEHKKASKYKGVYYEPSRNKWRASIRIDGKTKTLGRFPTEDEAHNCILNYKEEP